MRGSGFGIRSFILEEEASSKSTGALKEGVRLMNVPLLDLNAHHQPLRKELLAALEQVLDKNNFILHGEYI